MATALSSRPYSVNSFERKLIVFQDYIHEITLRESEDTQEDRRQKILGLNILLSLITQLECI